MIYICGILYVPMTCYCFIDLNTLYMYCIHLLAIYLVLTLNIIIIYLPIFTVVVLCKIKRWSDVISIWRMQYNQH